MSFNQTHYTLHFTTIRNFGCIVIARMAPARRGNLSFYKILCMIQRIRRFYSRREIATSGWSPPRNDVLGVVKACHYTIAWYYLSLPTLCLDLSDCNFPTHDALATSFGIAFAVMISFNMPLITSSFGLLAESIILCILPDNPS